MPTNRNLALFAAAVLTSAILQAATTDPLPDRTLPASVTVLTRADFANRHWFSVADILDQAVGIDVRRTAYRGTTATARLRGTGSSSGLVIAIDGRPVTHEFNGAVDLSQIPLNIIDRIEITRGGASVLYGPASAGIVNLVTTRPDRMGMTADLGTGVGRDGVRTHNGRFRIRNRAGDATYVGGLQDSGGFTDNDSSEFTSHFGNFTRSFLAGGFWGAEYLYTDGRAGKPDGTSVPFDQWNGHEENDPVDPSGREKREYQAMRLLAASPLIASGTIHAEFTHAFSDQDEFGAAGHLVDRDNQTTETRLRYDRSGLSVGGEFAGLARKERGIPRQRADRSALLATHNFRAGEWTFVPGVRWDHHSRGGDAPTFRAAVLFQPSSSWIGSLTAQRAPRFADFDDIFTAGGSARSLHPEESDSIDAGLVWKSERTRAGVTYFTSGTRDVIAQNGSGATVNGARERAEGVELEGSSRVGEGAWREVRLRGNVTLQNVKRRDIGAASYEQAPLAADEMAWASVELKMPWNTSLTNEVRFEGEQWSGSGQTGQKLPSFLLWNIRLNIRIHAADLYVAAENVLRERYAESLGSGGELAPQPERTFWTGITIRFLD